MSPLPRPASAQPLRAFAITWLGQLISLIGSELTKFAIGVHLFQASRSITLFSLVTFFQFLPMMLLSPLAGVLIDRWDRRRAMMLSDLGAGASTLLLWLLTLLDAASLFSLKPWHFLGLIGLGSCFTAFRMPALQAATALLIPQQHLPRANAFIELATGCGQILAPLFASLLLTRVGLRGILLLDLSTYLFAIGTLLSVRFPGLPTHHAASTVERSLSREMHDGWLFIRRRSGLIALLIFTAVLNLTWSMVIILISPLVLSFADVRTLGIIQAVAGLGMLAGGIFMGIWGGGRNRMQVVLGFTLLSAMILPLASLPPSTPFLALIAAAFLFTAPPISSCAQAIWQVKVPPQLQGRVFAMRRLFIISAVPLAGLLAGPLADRVFEPWLAPAGLLASSVGRILGTGPGRGIAFSFVVISAVLLAAVSWAYRSPRLRGLEAELPDALPDDGPPVIAARARTGAADRAEPEHETQKSGG